MTQTENPTDISSVITEQTLPISNVVSPVTKNARIVDTHGKTTIMILVTMEHATFVLKKDEVTADEKPLQRNPRIFHSWTLRIVWRNSVAEVNWSDSIMKRSRKRQIARMIFG